MLDIYKSDRVFNEIMKWTWLIILMLLIPAASAVSYPTLAGYVTDNANMIDQSYEAKISQLAGAIEKESTVQIAVVTVESLEGETRDMYAEELFKKAGIGKKGKDYGLLILVAKQEGEYRFEVGYGLESTVTDSMNVNIGERIIKPNFRNGEYGKGIYESMLVVQELVRGNPEIVSQYSMNQSSDSDAFVVLFIILLVLVVGFIFFIAIMNSTYGGGTIGRRRSGYREPRIGWGIGGGGFGGGRHGGGGFGGGFGGGGGGFGGGFGGFGGGRSGGGGFGGKW